LHTWNNYVRNKKIHSWCNTISSAEHPGFVTSYNSYYSDEEYGLTDGYSDEESVEYKID
jgi:hypothetical protein